MTLEALIVLMLGGATIAVFMFNRRRVRRMLQRQMNAHEDVPGTLAQDAPEVPAATRLAIEMLSCTRSSDHGRAHARAAAAARRRLRQSLVLDLAVALVFGIFVLPQVSDEDVSGLLQMFVGLSLLRYVLFRRQYWAGGADPWKTHYRFGFNLPPVVTVPLWILHQIAAAPLQMVLRWVLLLVLLYFAVFSGTSAPALAVTTVLLILVEGAFLHAVRRERPLCLLMLRVFHQDDTHSDSAVATFGDVLKRWLHFGAYVTVLDDVLLRFRNPIFSKRNAFVLIGIYIAAAVAEDEGYLWGPLEWAAILGGVVMTAAVDFALVYRSATRLLVARTDDMAKIEREFESRRGMDLKFAPVELPCLNSTWFAVVQDVARRADVVLMDLRGFAPERQGCELEVNLLFDTVPLERVLFMIGPGDAPKIADFFGRCWERLAADSPNLSVPEPRVRVFEYHFGEDSAKDRTAEKQVLLEEVLFAAAGDPNDLDEQRTQTKLPQAIAVASGWTDASVAANLAPASGDADLIACPAHLPSSDLAIGTVETQRHSIGPAVSRSDLARVELSAPDVTAIKEVLEKRASSFRLQVGQDITQRQATIARRKCGIPPEERLLALWPVTMFGSPSSCFAFTDRAMHYREWVGTRHTLRYAYFPNRKFHAASWSRFAIDGPGVDVKLDQGPLETDALVSVFEAIAGKVRRRCADDIEQVRARGRIAEAVRAALRDANAVDAEQREYYVDEAFFDEQFHLLRNACHISPEEEIIAVVGRPKAKHKQRCWVFTDVGLYSTINKERHFLDYTYLPERSITKGWLTYKFTAPDGSRIKIEPPIHGDRFTADLIESVQGAVAAAR